ncbi:MAG TPA: hypothetical protein VIW29_11195 [Polyangiaceae bacterium]
MLRSLLLGSCLAVACGAGATPAPSSPPPAPAPAPAPVAVAPASSVEASPPPAQGPIDSPGFEGALATLRPAVAEPAVEQLAAAPAEAALYARAALAYADTDVPAMSLLWGMTYQAMGGGKEDAKVAAALARILAERIRVTHDEASERVDFNVRLAPGQMPTRHHPDGSLEAPLAHAFEGLFSAALTGFRPPWTVEQFYDSLSSWVAFVNARPTPLDELVPLNAWLVLLAKAGHLEAYCHRLLGPAFAPELKAYQRGHAAELKALTEYLKANRLAPTRAPLPNELVRVKRVAD